MMDRLIDIRCSGAHHLTLEELVPLQGNLKTLTNENYQKLKKQMLRLGYSEPIAVWFHEDKYFIINGHQRYNVLKAMQEDGYEIPKLPVSLVEASSLKEAKEKVLSLTAQYGEITDEGLYEFMAEADLKLPDLADLRFPEIDMVKFDLKFFTDGEVVEDPSKEWKGMPEFVQEDKLGYQHIVVHFKTKDDVESFARLVAQNITDKTRSIWYPEAEIETYMDKRYESES